MENKTLIIIAIVLASIGAFFCYDYKLSLECEDLSIDIAKNADAFDFTGLSDDLKNEIESQISIYEDSIRVFQVNDNLNSDFIDLLKDSIHLIKENHKKEFIEWTKEFDALKKDVSAFKEEQLGIRDKTIKSLTSENDSLKRANKILKEELTIYALKIDSFKTENNILNDKIKSFEQMLIAKNEELKLKDRLLMDSFDKIAEIKDQTSEAALLIASSNMFNRKKRNKEAKLLLQNAVVEYKALKAQLNSTIFDTQINKLDQVLTTFS